MPPSVGGAWQSAQALSPASLLMSALKQQAISLMVGVFMGAALTTGIATGVAAGFLANGSLLRKLRDHATALGTAARDAVLELRGTAARRPPPPPQQQQRILASSHAAASAGRDSVDSVYSAVSDIGDIARDITNSPTAQRSASLDSRPRRQRRKGSRDLVASLSGGAPSGGVIHVMLWKWHESCSALVQRACVLADMRALFEPAELLSLSVGENVVDQLGLADVFYDGELKRQLSDGYDSGLFCIARDDASFRAWWRGAANAAFNAKHPAYSAKKINVEWLH